MNKAILYSSRSEVWGTPPDLFARLNAIYDFRLDAAANDANALCPRYFTEAENGLAQEWRRFGRVWLNPPYGRTIAAWMRKAHEESRAGCLVVCLVPARTDTRWWHDWVVGKAQVTFLKGRLKFVAANSDAQADAAPFPSAIVTYEPDLARLFNKSGITAHSGDMAAAMDAGRCRRVDGRG